MTSSVGASNEYLNELLQDKTTISKMPKIFVHVERLLDQEITKVRNELFGPGPTNGVECPLPTIQGEPIKLPTPSGNKIKLTEKVYAPVKDHPKYNFVGRVIGPRGLTLRSVEYETGCKLLVRGRGSMKDKKMEEEKRGQPNYEHLDEELHVLISVEDTEERANIRMQTAVEKVKGLLQPIEEGEDLLKKKQLKDLAFFNGTLRETGAAAAAAAAGVMDFYASNYFGSNTDKLMADRQKFNMVDRNTQWLASNLWGDDKEKSDLDSTEFPDPHSVITSRVETGTATQNGHISRWWPVGNSSNGNDQNKSLATPASVLQNAGLLGVPLTAAGLQAYSLHPRPAAPAAYAPLGLELQGYTTAPRTVLDYGALEPAIIGAVKPRRPIREHPYQR